ncbi:ArsR family transcriptional regulator [Sphaerisporangium rufum]|uniref:ArsR family transcriptional regulator n=1 Tax=Sphaerisporangium rufum TaxID=1381558 RepID=A0A919V068_9ACTN|nr:ArsR family transcriptional regulator [Sphaerisporangium rufum]
MADLELLHGQLDAVTRGTGTTRGRALIMTGRRRVGKSRLVQEFCDRAGVPYIYFQATKNRPPAAERRELAEALTCSEMPQRELVTATDPGDWNHALRSVAVAAGDRTPCVVVLDEVPWLIEQDRGFEGALQTVWDRHLSSRPVLLILVGSDLSIMESLQAYDRPFFGRASRMTVRPLELPDVAQMTGLGAAEAIDALLITGGLPEIVQSWAPGMSRVDFLRAGLGNPLSPLLMAGELSLLGEFPEATHTRAVLEAVGSGERTFSTIAGRVGGAAPLHSGTLAPILANLVAKRVVSVDLPLSTLPDNKNKRYRVADPYLRFWLAFLQRAVAESERGRPDVALRRIERSWSAWRGRAVEPVVRERLERLLPDDAWPDAEHVGGWWNRQNNPEIDLVAADRVPVAGRIQFVGSIKWLDARPFDRHDYDELVRGAAAVPGWVPDTPVVAVSRAGVEAGLPLAASWGPAELLTARGG